MFIIIKDEKNAKKYCTGEFQITSENYSYLYENLSQFTEQKEANLGVLLFTEEVLKDRVEEIQKYLRKWQDKLIACQNIEGSEYLNRIISEVPAMTNKEKTEWFVKSLMSY